MSKPETDRKPETDSTPVEVKTAPLAPGEEDNAKYILRDGTRTGCKVLYERDLPTESDILGYPTTNPQPNTNQGQLSDIGLALFCSLSIARVCLRKYAKSMHPWGQADR